MDFNSDSKFRYINQTSHQFTNKEAIKSRIPSRQLTSSISNPSVTSSNIQALCSVYNVKQNGKMLNRKYTQSFRHSPFKRFDRNNCNINKVNSSIFRVNKFDTNTFNNANNNIQNVNSTNDKKQIQKSPNNEIQKSPSNEIKWSPSNEIQRSPSNEIKRFPSNEIKKSPSDQLIKQRSSSVDQRKSTMTNQPEIPIMPGMLRILPDEFQMGTNCGNTYDRLSVLNKVPTKTESALSSMHISNPNGDNEDTGNFVSSFTRIHFYLMNFLMILLLLYESISFFVGFAHTPGCAQTDIYLVVSSLLCITIIMIEWFMKWVCVDSTHHINPVRHYDAIKLCSGMALIIIYIFEIVWFFLGFVWVPTEYIKAYNEDLKVELIKANQTTVPTNSPLTTTPYVRGYCKLSFYAFGLAYQIIHTVLMLIRCLICCFSDCCRGICYRFSLETRNLTMPIIPPYGENQHIDDYLPPIQSVLADQFPNLLMDSRIRPNDLPPLNSLDNNISYAEKVHKSRLSGTHQHEKNISHLLERYNSKF